MSKYEDLEGFDFNSKEVYETEVPDDKKEVNNNLYNSTIEEQANDAINNSGLEIGKAYEIFSNAEEKDTTKKYEIDYLAGKIEKSKSQSLSQQLRRLIKEVDDLKFKIEQEKENNHLEFPVNTEEAQELEANVVKGSTEAVEEADQQVEITSPPQNANISGAISPSKQINKTSPSYMLDQASKLQNELEKLTLGIVNDDGHGINAIENILIQQKMINQIKDCKVNALKEESPLSENNNGETDEDQNIVNTLPTVPDESHSMTTHDGITYKLYYSPKSIQYHQLARISDLEERITQIEAILGINSITDDNILFPSNNQISTLLYAKGNIVTAIDSLDQQLQLLSQPSNFDNILIKVNEAIKELEQFINIQKNKLAEEEIDEQAQIKEKVDALYSKLESTEEYSAIITPLLTRLKTLQALHTEASQFSESIQMFSEQQNAIKNQIKDLQEMMSNLSESLEVNKTIIENNIDSISKRIDQLMDRVKEL
ncbi:hypothetical protein H8356DRAFT_517207 [Neocallimastix lanati (nom. inval.)]|jgi:hypothetical protein|uniref:Dynactin subunit 2 n=1 Tax=Neocallimastix californiae TaxID=1754190 RepID=A0A1Y2D932_9FUNG|nr:hypothetical protein H8356DRAFT_517207 [Neocallimastix sp. JGI-2020a]ORY55771.1 hypothetical protein LY90DRAFT_506976 [Neocallimastix californiae]|eukprot:ORY55771.1 hypothetical protein LY90DRAFT_506976 [Neocallimastix californiae]